mmetsp:Transcript_36966/g.103234  ORF Transcript_36966/g.103234 Transcript_36966/m.103234 type:complete len:205 (+) Transcript_36966:182-796(+)
MSKARNSDTHRGASYVGTRNGLAHIENYHAAHHDATSYGVCNALGLLGPSNGTSSRAAAATATLRHWAAVHRRRGSFSSIPASSSCRSGPLTPRLAKPGICCTENRSWISAWISAGGSSTSPSSLRPSASTRAVTGSLPPSNILANSSPSCQTLFETPVGFPSTISGAQRYADPPDELWTAEQGRPVPTKHAWLKSEMTARSSG